MNTQIPGLRLFSEGVETEIDSVMWGAQRAAMLGCGFRVVVPHSERDEGRAEALAHARVQAAEVASVLGADLDEAPFAAAATWDGPCVLEGGWTPVFRAGLGPAVTALLPGSMPRARRRVEVVEVPFTADVDSVTAPLAMLADTHAALAATHAGEHAGLIRHADSTLSHSTHGALLLCDEDGRWFRPAPPAPGRRGHAESWRWRELVARLDAQPRRVEQLPTSSAAVALAVDEWGTLTELVGGASETASHGLLDRTDPLAH